MKSNRIILSAVAVVAAIGSSLAFTTKHFHSSNQVWKKEPACTALNLTLFDTGVTPTSIPANDGYYTTVGCSSSKEITVATTAYGFTTN
jgi:hypothetical protein